MKKMNNKGFSLVELIVVIAIMAILAVTLAPRLTQYVEKSRKASDQEAVNTIFTAAKLANLEEPLGKSVAAKDLGAAADALYTVDDREWTLNADFPEADSNGEEFWKIMKETLGDFELKSNEVNAVEATPTTIKLTTDADGKITVALDYDGDVGTEADYVVSE